MPHASQDPATRRVHLHQIAYSPATLAAIEPGYEVLDNMDNARPDWYEYWPIRRHLLSATLDDDAWYGFFSPKFGQKTGLTHADVVRAVQESPADCQVVVFSPQPDMGAFFLNVFEQGEVFDPGSIDTCERLLQSIGRPVPLRPLVMDSRQIVFSNYFVARPAFWRAWLELNEEIFRVCEAGEGELARELTRPTTYPGAVQRKVFLMERMASLLLATDARWRPKAANPFNFAWSASRLRQFPTEAVMSDALKLAFREQGFPQYLAAFSALRDQFMKSAPGAASSEG